MGIFAIFDDFCPFFGHFLQKKRGWNRKIREIREKRRWMQDNGIFTCFSVPTVVLRGKVGKNVQTCMFSVRFFPICNFLNSRSLPRELAWIFFICFIINYLNVIWSMKFKEGESVGIKLAIMGSC
jgi:hypothetical protein